MRILPKLIPTVAAAMVVASSMLVACSSSTEESAPPVVAPCSDVTVDRFKELAVVDESVIDDPRTSNATAGPWSFRHAIENMMPAGADGGEFVRQWLDVWVTATQLNGYPLDHPDARRGAEMQTLVLCPWLKRTESNNCNLDCSSCDAQKLDLASAPFRLIGIFNRIDLRETSALAGAGEGRLLFALTPGPGDDRASRALPMSVIFEYHHASTRSPKAWAEAWHSLGRHASFDEAYKSELQQLTDGFTKRGARPEGPGGSSLAQIRTNESAFNWIWQFREFALENDRLTLRPLANTPARGFDGSPALINWVGANSKAILENRHELPLAMRGGVAELISVKPWNVPNVEPAVRNAFAASTCNGCHSQENPTVDTAFHVSVYQKGIAKLSPFLNSPEGKADELLSRTKSMQRALCGL